MEDLIVLRYALLRHVAAVFDALHATPWRLDARNGVLHLAGEPLVLPRHWLRDDPGCRHLEPRLRDAWDALARRPVRQQYEIDERPLFLWGECVWLHEPGTADAAWMTDTINGGHEPVVAADFRTGLFDTLVAAARRVLPVSLPSPSPDPAADDACADSPEAAFIADLAGIIVDELAAHIPLEELGGLLDLLAADAGHWLEERYAADPPVPGLRARHARLQAALAEAAAWRDRDAACAPFVLFAVDAGHAATPGGVLAWLADAGLSRRNRQRLARVPVAWLAAFARDWAWYAPDDWRPAVAWLGRWLGWCHQYRDAATPHDNGLASARLAAALGIYPALPPPIAIDNDFPRASHYWSPADAGEAGAMDFWPSRLWHRPVLDDPRATALLATATRTLFTGGAGVLADIYALGDDLAHWLLVEWDELHPRQLGPDWAALVRGLREFEARFQAHFRAHAGARVAERLLPPVAPPLPATRITWPTPCPGFTLGDFRVLPLASNIDLYHESRELEHCVATYTNACLRGDCQLFSIRHADDNTPVATVEFRAPLRIGRAVTAAAALGAACGAGMAPPGKPWVQVPGDWQLVQCRGWRNAEWRTSDGSVLPPLADVVAELQRRLVAATCLPVAC